MTYHFSHSLLVRNALVFILAIMPLAAEVIPVNLQAPDNKPVDKTKPVRDGINRQTNRGPFTTCEVHY